MNPSLTMQEQDFSPLLWKELSSKILEAKQKNKPPYIAAFDADGTLWNEDAGDVFYKYQIKHFSEKLPANPWEHYQDIRNDKLKSAFEFLVGTCSGFKLEDIHKHAEACYRQSTYSVFRSQKKLIQFLHENDFEVYIVTASVKWAVEPAAATLNIDKNHVIGVEAYVENGIITNQHKEPITYGPGKPVALLEKTGGVQPILSAGNTMGDLFLLEQTTDIRLAIKSHKENEPLFKTETELKDKALQEGWFTHDFTVNDSTQGLS